MSTDSSECISVRFSPGGASAPHGNLSKPKYHMDIADTVENDVEENMAEDYTPKRTM